MNGIDENITANQMSGSHNELLEEVRNLFIKLYFWREESQNEFSNIMNSHNKSINKGINDFVKQVGDLQGQVSDIKKERDDLLRTLNNMRGRRQPFPQPEKEYVDTPKHEVKDALENANPKMSTDTNDEYEDTTDSITGQHDIIFSLKTRNKLSSHDVENVNANKSEQITTEEKHRSEEVDDILTNVTLQANHNYPECNSVYSTSADLITHTQSAHGKLKVEDMKQNKLIATSESELIADTKTPEGQKIPDKSDAQQVYVNNDTNEDCDYTISEIKEHKTPVKKLPESKCKECSFTSTLKENVKKHVEREHGKIENHICEECGYSTLYKSNFTYHRASVHNIGNKHFKCQQCSYETIRKYLMRRHTENVHDKIIKMKSHICEECGYATAQKSSLKMHRASVHKIGANLVQCEQCSFTSFYSGQMKFHIQVVHEKIKNHVCEDCGSAFAQKGGLKKHRETVHKIGVKQVKCEQCSYVAIHKDYLKQHVNTVHKKIKKHACKECGFATDKKDKLKGHMVSIHKMGEKNIKCNLCSYATVRNEYMKMHINSVHKKIKNYVCDECGYAASQKRNLYVHRELVHKTGDKKFLCEKCPYTSNLKANLKTHIEGVHEKKRKHVCDECGYAANLKATLKKHRESVHKTEAKANNCTSTQESQTEATKTIPLNGNVRGEQACRDKDEVSTLVTNEGGEITDDVSREDAQERRLQQDNSDQGGSGTACM